MEKKKLSVKSVIELIFVILMLVILAIFAVRIFMYSEKPFASELIWSDAAKAAYSKSPNDFVIYEIPSVSVSKGLDYTLSGMPHSDTTNYTVSNLVYFDYTKELQMTVKYPVRELSDKNVTVPYLFELEDDKGTRYTVSTITTKEITGYIYCRVTFADVDIFTTNTLAFFIKDGRDDIDARLIYSTQDRISESGISAYGISYSEGKNKYSVRVRIPDGNSEAIELITVKGDGAVIKPTSYEISDAGMYSSVFIELENISLENYGIITVTAGDTDLVVYDAENDRTLLEDYSTDDYKCYAYYVIPSDKFITPVTKKEFKAPDLDVK